MVTEKLKKSILAWKFYLGLLWSVAVIFLGLIIYGIIAIQTRADKNPASGLAIVGVFFYILILIVYIGFVLLNSYIKKRIQHNEKVSWRFLIISWVVIVIAVVISLFTIIQGAMAQDYYEKNILPRDRACYEDYLNGKRTSPHCS